MRRQSTRSLSVFLSLLLATCVLGLGPALAATGDSQVNDVLGAWKLKCTSPDGKPRECILVVSREGAVLRGDYSVGRTTKPARYVVFERGELIFGLDGKYAGQVYTVTYKERPREQLAPGWRSTRKYGWASGSFDFLGEGIAQGVATNP